jgi:hypothetical protein
VYERRVYEYGRRVYERRVCGRSVGEECRRGVHERNVGEEWRRGVDERSV